MEQESSNEFWKQFGGSASANVFFVIGFFIYKFVQSRCKHSRCSSTTSCFKCSVDNDETLRGGKDKVTELLDAVRSKESMPKVQTAINPKISERHFEAVKEPRPRKDSGSWGLAKV